MKKSLIIAVLTVTALSTMLVGCNNGVKNAVSDTSKSSQETLANNNPKSVAESMVKQQVDGNTSYPASNPSNVKALNVEQVKDVSGVPYSMVYVEFDYKGNVKGDVVSKDTPMLGCGFIQLSQNGTSWHSSSFVPTVKIAKSSIVTNQAYEEEAKTYLASYAKSKGISINKIYRALYTTEDSKQYATWFVEYTTKESQKSFAIIKICKEDGKWQISEADDWFLSHEEL